MLQPGQNSACMKSGFVDDKTKWTFRSQSAQFFLLVQVTSVAITGG